MVSISSTCLHAAFTRADPKSEKKTSHVMQLFALSGSACIKAARKHVDEIDPGLLPILLNPNYRDVKARFSLSRRKILDPISEHTRW